MHSLDATSFLTETEIELQRMARRFMDNEVASLAPDMEKTGLLNMDLMRQMGQLGLLGTFFPEKYGGGGFTIETTI